MHIHLPKALHGWREFAKEVGIIVVGVLIALGAEQIVTEMHWRKQVSDTRSALGTEIGASLRYAAERLSVQQCVRGRIAELAMKLRNSKGSWAADPMPIGKTRWMVEVDIPAAYRTPAEPWRTLGRCRLTSLAIIYSSVQLESDEAHCADQIVPAV
jgi:hypothetical protein